MLKTEMLSSPNSKTNRDCSPSTTDPALRRAGGAAARSCSAALLRAPDRSQPAGRGCRRSREPGTPATADALPRRSPTAVDARAGLQAVELRPAVRVGRRRHDRRPTGRSTCLIGDVVRQRSADDADDDGPAGHIADRQRHASDLLGIRHLLRAVGRRAERPAPAARRRSRAARFIVSQRKSDASSLAPHRLQKQRVGSFAVPHAHRPARLRLRRRTGRHRRRLGTRRRRRSGGHAARCNSRSMIVRYPLPSSSSCFISDSARPRSRAAISSKSACDTLPIARSNSRSLSARSTSTFSRSSDGARALGQRLRRRRDDVSDERRERPIEAGSREAGRSNRQADRGRDARASTGAT